MKGYYDTFHRFANGDGSPEGELSSRFLRMSAYPYGAGGQFPSFLGRTVLAGKPVKSNNEGLPFTCQPGDRI